MPFASLGFGTAFMFCCAALFLRGISRAASIGLWASTAVYAVATGVFLTNSSSVTGSLQDNLSTVAIGVTVFIGGCEAVVLAPWLVRRLRGPNTADANELIADMSSNERAELAHDPAVRLAIHQRERRKMALDIVAKDRALATTLCIGRPDLLRDFDDGGLIDVNHVPLAVFATLPGIDVEMARRINSARQRFDGLRSPADLVVHADIPPEVVAALDDRLIFVADEP
jgi:DNA uptake protein ComE-like DNA-binding protein